MGREGRPAREIRLPAKLRDDICEPLPKKPPKLYCLCKQPYEKGAFMIACDSEWRSPDCVEWCHGSCVGISPQEALKIKEYVCPACSSAGEADLDSREDTEEPEIEQGRVTGTRSNGNKRKWKGKGGEKASITIGIDCHEISDSANFEEVVSALPAYEEGSTMSTVDGILEAEPPEALGAPLEDVQGTQPVLKPEPLVEIEDVGAAPRKKLSIKRHAEETIPRAASLQRMDNGYTTAIGPPIFIDPGTSPLIQDLGSPKVDGTSFVKPEREVDSPRKTGVSPGITKGEGNAWLTLKSERDIDSPRKTGLSPGIMKGEGNSWLVDSPRKTVVSPGSPVVKNCAHSGCEKPARKGQWYCSIDCEKAAEKETLAKKRMREATINVSANKRRMREVTKPIIRVPTVSPSNSVLTGRSNQQAEISRTASTMRQKLCDSLAAALALVAVAPADSPTDDMKVDPVQVTETGDREISSTEDDAEKSLEVSPPESKTETAVVTMQSQQVAESLSVDPLFTASIPVSAELSSCDSTVHVSDSITNIPTGQNDVLTIVNTPGGLEKTESPSVASGTSEAITPSVIVDPMDGQLYVDDEDRGKMLREKASELATEIESEMFTVFGGASKKYRERARSLLFNLKDPANPELRQKVMNGEIAPQELCLMTAEQLASRELAQWRTLKEKEHAQQVVLPSDDNMWRVVKKTHKGEVVLLQRDEDMDVVPNTAIAQGLNSSRLPSSSDFMRTGVLETRALQDSKNESKVDSKVQRIEGSAKQNTAEHTKGGERAQMKDESKNEDEGDEAMSGVELPAIMSLDEYMEARGGRKAQEVVQDIVQEQVESPPSSPSAGPEPDLPSPTTPRETQAWRVTTEQEEWLADKNNREVWEGKLQLGSAGLCKVRLIYHSGERLPVKDCLDDVVEVKGRVRHSQMERFFGSLRTSRARVVMIVGITSGLDSEGENNRELVQEAAEQYRESERIGFAELNNGGELYLLPRSKESLDLLHQHGYIFPSAEATNVDGELLLGAFIRRRSGMPAWALQRTEGQSLSSPAKVQASVSGTKTPSKTVASRPTTNKSKLSLPPGFESRMAQNRSTLVESSGDVSLQARGLIRDPRRRPDEAVSMGSPVSVKPRRAGTEPPGMGGRNLSQGEYGSFSEGTGRQKFSEMGARSQQGSYTFQGGGGGSREESEDLPEFNFDAEMSSGPLMPSHATVGPPHVSNTHRESQTMSQVSSSLPSSVPLPIPVQSQLGGSLYSRPTGPPQPPLPLPPPPPLSLIRPASQSCVTNIPTTHVLGAPWNLPNGAPPSNRIVDPSFVENRHDSGSLSVSMRSSHPLPHPHQNPHQNPNPNPQTHTHTNAHNYNHPQIPLQWRPPPSDPMMLTRPNRDPPISYPQFSNEAVERSNGTERIHGTERPHGNEFLVHSLGHPPNNNLQRPNFVVQPPQTQFFPQQVRGREGWPPLPYGRDYSKK